MKNLKNLSRKVAVAAIALFMVPSFSALAQSNIHLGLYKDNTSIAEIEIENLSQEQPVSIALRNAAGTVLFSDNSSASHYVKMLDFAKLNDGQYALDISRPKGVVRKMIVKKGESIVINNETLVFHNYIKFQDEDKKLLVKFNNTLDESVTLRIMDNEGNILHEETGIKANTYATLFNLSKLSKGAYNMSLVSGGFTNNRTIQL